jgi:ClpP class serine protease
MLFWLLEASIYQAIATAKRTGLVPNAEQQAAFSASHFSESASDSSGILTTGGEIAIIQVKGVITQAPDFLASIFGGGNVTYAEIIGAIAAAEADANITSIRLEVDSPGGEFSGMFEALDAVKNATKPVHAVVGNLAASAAFALVSQADTIEATSRAARFGSVGVKALFFVDEDEVEIASTEAPNKVPDVTTEEGKAIVREELDALHEIFAEAIAEGRNTTVEKVNENFGQGGMLLADAALKRGMIDTVAKAATPELRVVKSADSTTAREGGNQSEHGDMNLHELQAQNPDVYAAAVKVGTDNERDRVQAHLTMGEASGDMATATAAISAGDGMTASLQAKYLAAGMNRSDVSAHQIDSDEASAANSNAAPATTETDADKVAGIVEARLGIEGVIA